MSRRVCELILRSASKKGLSCSSQSFTGMELAGRVGGFATALRRLGFLQGDTVGMCLTNSCDNVVVQLAGAVAGISIVTTKTATELVGKVGELGCKGVVVSRKDEASLFAASTLLHPPIISSDHGHNTVERLSQPSSIQNLQQFLHDEEKAECELFYNSSKSISLSNLLALGQSSSARLKLTSSDVVCIPITLNHSMGFGFGVLGALCASGGNAGIAISSTDLASTLACLQKDASVLLADSHTLKTLQAEKNLGVFPNLRIGLTKVGSGEAFDLGPAVKWAGIEFVTVGKP